jgi:hypothetical protein
MRRASHPNAPYGRYRPEARDGCHGADSAISKVFRGLAVQSADDGSRGVAAALHADLGKPGRAVKRHKVTHDEHLRVPRQ